MEKFPEIRVEGENESFEMDFILHSDDERNGLIVDINDNLSQLEDQQNENSSSLQQNQDEIERLTNKADATDIMVAAGCGIITGILDSLFVGDFSLDKANEWGDKTIEEFVKRTAKSKGYKGDDLADAVRKLEKDFPITADKATNDFGGGLYHHIRDFSHHPTPFGLACSIITQFTGKAYGTNKAGAFLTAPISDLTLIGKTIGEKFTYGVVNWIFHMISDMAGSSGSIMKNKVGTGLPGPIVSMLKELSALPIFNQEGKDNNFSREIGRLFNGLGLAKRDEQGNIMQTRKFDLRTEIGIAKQLSNQALVVLLNECLVRGFFLIRQVCREIKEKDIRHIKDINEIDKNKIRPWGNRTIARMITVSTSVFFAIDAIGAGIKTAVKGEVASIPTFLKGMALRINYVGAGRMVVAVGQDAILGLQRYTKSEERMQLLMQQLSLENVKICYKQAGMWVSAENMERTMLQIYEAVENSLMQYMQTTEEIAASLDTIDKAYEGVKANNPELIKKLKNILD